MSKILPIFNSWSAGEISGRIINRFDTDAYRAGANTVQNWLSTSHGPVGRRGGSEHIEGITAPDGRILPFYVNQSTGFVIVLTGDGKLIVNDESGVVLDADDQLLLNSDFQDLGANWTPSGSSVTFRTGSVELNPTSVTEAVVAQSVAGLTGANEHLIKVVNASGTGIEIKIGTSANDDSLASLTSFAKISSLSFTPGVDTFFVTVLAPIDGGDVIISSIELFDIDVAPTQIEFTTGYDSAAVEIVQFALPSGDNVMYLVTNRFPTKKLTYDLDTQAWTFADVVFVSPPAEWAGSNHPGAITFFQGRMWLAATPEQPERFWASKSALFEDFTLGDGTAEDDAFEFELDFKGAIQWMEASRNLVLGTENQELIATSEGGILKSGDIQIEPQSAFGSRKVQSLKIGERVMFISPDGRKLRDTKFEFSADLFTSRDLTFFSEQITKDRPITEIWFAQNPDNLMWFRTFNGEFLAMTYERSFDIIGWSRHNTDGQVLSMTVLESFGSSQTWFLVKRDIEGIEDQIFLEKYDPDVYLDGFSRIENQTAFNAITVPTLAGKTVSILADGSVHPQITLDSNGFGVLNSLYNLVLVGLPFNSLFKTLNATFVRPEGGSNRVQLKRWNKIFVALDGSNVPKINGKRPPDRTPSTPMDTREPEITQLVKVTDLGYDRDGKITIEEDLPVRTRVTGIFGELSGDNL